MKKTTTRVQMELPEKSIERLQRLKEKTEASSYAEVTKNSYRLYELLIEITENRGKILLEDEDGQRELFVL